MLHTKNTTYQKVIKQIGLWLPSSFAKSLNGPISNSQMKICARKLSEQSWMNRMGIDVHLTWFRTKEHVIVLF